jgi:hypothetical protein
MRRGTANAVIAGQRQRCHREAPGCTNAVTASRSGGTNAVIARRRHGRRGDLVAHGVRVRAPRDCFVTAFLAMTAQCEPA